MKKEIRYVRTRLALHSLTVMDDFLATNSLSHLAPCFAEISLETLFAHVESTNRVQFLQQLKDEFGVALLPDRQKLANTLRKAASRAAKGWSDDMAAKVSSPDSIAPLIVRSMYGMGNQLRGCSYRAAANKGPRARAIGGGRCMPWQVP